MKALFSNIYVSGQINTQDFPKIAEQGIKIIINNRPDGEENGQLDHQQAKQLAEQHGIDYYYLPMANGQPLPANLVSDFKKIIDNNPNKAILTHCRSGLRSSFIWALGQIQDGTISVDTAIDSAKQAGIALDNFRQVLETVQKV